MGKRFEPLYYLHRIKDTPHNLKMRGELVNVCGFTNEEAKKTLHALENYAKIISETNDGEGEFRRRVLKMDLQWNGFRYLQIKKNMGGHVMVKFFNYLIWFMNGEEEYFDRISECVYVDMEKKLYGFIGI